MSDKIISIEPVDVTVADLTFTLRICTRRADAARRVLIREGNRYLANYDFKTALDQMMAAKVIHPFYYDILAATTAVNGDPKHPLLVKFLSDPAEFDEWANDDEDGTKEADLIQAVLKAQELNSHWYPQPTITADTEPEAQKKVSDTLTALDPDSTSDAEQASTAELTEAVGAILDAVEKKQQAEAEETGEAESDFLDRSK